MTNVDWDGKVAQICTNICQKRKRNEKVKKMACGEGRNGW